MQYVIKHFKEENKIESKLRKGRPNYTTTTKKDKEHGRILASITLLLHLACTEVEWSLEGPSAAWDNQLQSSGQQWLQSLSLPSYTIITHSIERLQSYDHLIPRLERLCVLLPSSVARQPRVGLGLLKKPFSGQPSSMSQLVGNQSFFSGAVYVHSDNVTCPFNSLYFDEVK
ncbi:hypothetical protein TNCV_2003921 [Trichonephila clavipes]|nr:hypothetical protein TNCV_2003921 [Trichonephila clavipes]